MDGHKLFFCRNWFEKGVLFIQDLLKGNGTFPSCMEFIQKYHLSCNFLIYFQVVSSILKHLLEKARLNPLAKSSCSLNHVEAQTTSNCTIWKD